MNLYNASNMTNCSHFIMGNLFYRISPKQRKVAKTNCFFTVKLPVVCLWSSVLPKVLFAFRKNPTKKNSSERKQHETVVN